MIATGPPLPGPAGELFRQISSAPTRPGSIVTKSQSFSNQIFSKNMWIDFAVPLVWCDQTFTNSNDGKSCENKTLSVVN